jgi:hypothetical protein
MLSNNIDETPKTQKKKKKRINAIVAKHID